MEGSTVIERKRVTSEENHQTFEIGKFLGKVIRISSFIISNSKSSFIFR